MSKDPSSFWEACTNDTPGNAPKEYAKHIERSIALTKEFEELSIDPHSTILEIGCNSCRNLAKLYAEGYSNLTGFDVCPAAISSSKELFPKLSAHTFVGKAPESLGLLTTKFDVVFTMAVLMHLSTDAQNKTLDWIKDNTKIFIGIERGSKSGYKYREAKAGNVCNPIDLTQPLIDRGFKIVKCEEFEVLRTKRGNYTITVASKI